MTTALVANREWREKTERKWNCAAFNSVTQRHATVEITGWSGERARWALRAAPLSALANSIQMCRSLLISRLQSDLYSKRKLFSSIVFPYFISCAFVHCAPLRFPGNSSSGLQKDFFNCMRRRAPERGNDECSNKVRSGSAELQATLRIAARLQLCKQVCRYFLWNAGESLRCQSDRLISETFWPIGLRSSRPRTPTAKQTQRVVGWVAPVSHSVCLSRDCELIGEQLVSQYPKMK